MLTVADWLAAVTGRDPADGVRGTYSDEAGARIVLSRLGWWAGLARRAGLARTDRPVAGDVGVIAGRPDVLGICLGEAWVFQARHGLGYVRAPIVRRAWSCPRP